MREEGHTNTPSGLRKLAILYEFINVDANPVRNSGPLLGHYRIIGLSGKIGSGKTTFSNYLRTVFPDLEPHSFADNLRQVVSILIDRPVDQLRSATDKETMTCMGKTVGVLLQEVGTEVVRSINPDAWVLSLFERYKHGESYWIIDDVRFVNEAACIKEAGGIMIRFEGDPGQVRKNSTRDLNHPSETALDNYSGFDVIVETEQYMNDMQGIFERINKELWLQKTENSDAHKG